MKWDFIWCFIRPPNEPVFLGIKLHVMVHLRRRQRGVGIHPKLAVQELDKLTMIVHFRVPLLQLVQD